MRKPDPIKMTSFGRFVFITATIVVLPAVALLIWAISTGDAKSLPDPWRGIVLIYGMGVGFFGGLAYVLYVAVRWTRINMYRQAVREYERSLIPRDERVREKKLTAPSRADEENQVYRYRMEEPDAAAIRRRLLVYTPLALLGFALVAGYFFVWRQGIGRNAHTFAFTLAVVVVIIIYGGMTAFIAPWREELLELAGPVLRVVGGSFAFDLREPAGLREDRDGLYLETGAYSTPLHIPWETEGYAHLKERIEHFRDQAPDKFMDPRLAGEHLRPLFKKISADAIYLTMYSSTAFEKFLLGVWAFFSFLTSLGLIILLWQSRPLGPGDSAVITFTWFGIVAAGSFLLWWAARLFRPRFEVERGERKITRITLFRRTVIKGGAFGCNTARAVYLTATGPLPHPAVQTVYYVFARSRKIFQRVGNSGAEYLEVGKAAAALARMTGGEVLEVPEGKARSIKGETKSPFIIDHLLVISLYVLITGFIVGFLQAADLVPGPFWLEWFR